MTIAPTAWEQVRQRAGCACEFLAQLHREKTELLEEQQALLAKQRDLLRLLLGEG
jgi:hypothetical protein